MKKLVVVFASVLLFASCTQTKIGYVDVAEIMKEYDATKALEEEMKGEQEKMTKTLDSIAAPFQAKVEDFYKKAQRMSQKTLQAKQAELEQENQQIQQMQQQAQQILQAKSQQGLEVLTKKIDSVVGAYATSNKFNLILSTQETSSVIHGDEQLNLTETILDILNVEFDETK